MDEKLLEQLNNGFKTAYLDANSVSDPLFQPQFIYNNSLEGKKVLSSIEKELSNCSSFKISVAFITQGGIEPLLQVLKILESKGIKGQILTTNYLTFSEPKALEMLNNLNNIELKMYDVNAAENGFHTKAYIFENKEIYKIIIGSSNLTGSALTTNKEWNIKVISSGDGETGKDILDEFDKMWNSKYSFSYDDFISNYRVQYEYGKEKRALLKKPEAILNKELKPNSMQESFVNNLKEIIATGEERALLISATGTGKTYASAFAMRELGFKRVLFLVHRTQLAIQTKASYEKVFNNSIKTGLVSGTYKDYDADYIFATVQTVSKDDSLTKFKKDQFDCIILDEAHHTSANTYQKIMNYFKPKFYLGMTATPDKRDDNLEGKNIYEIFHYQIAYEIRLQQAMEQDLLCPFHYFGISDLEVINDDKTYKPTFGQLTSNERVRHILNQADYYKPSGSRTKGLVFCSSIEESIELSRKFNDFGYRTIALNGDSSEEERKDAFDRLAMDEGEHNGKEPLDYIFSVEILNEGVDIIEVNQVIMLRPTESPIIFIQQLGRGLRKAKDKEFVVVLDFIGNYKKNFMIPVALSGDRSYSADTMRKYIISGNSIIPGASTIHFDEIAKEKIFKAIDNLTGIKNLIKESYYNLKNRLNRVPYLNDYIINNEVDPKVIIDEYKSYQSFLEKVESDTYTNKLNKLETLTISYLSKTILSGLRIYETYILSTLIKKDSITISELENELKDILKDKYNEESLSSAYRVLMGCFVINKDEYEKTKEIALLDLSLDGTVKRSDLFNKELNNEEFKKQLLDILEVSSNYYYTNYYNFISKDIPFTLYEKYSRRDISLLMNYSKDESSTMYGMSRFNDDVFIFVTYHKVSSDETNYVEGKPDYADEFKDQYTFNWDSQIGAAIGGKYMNKVTEAKRKHLFVKKSDAENNFYYMGTFNIDSITPATKLDNDNKEKPICKLVFKMNYPVREDILNYLESSIEVEHENN